ncbi:MAG TPA: GDSL-type esterase/lipase family protein [Pseudolabrys sp.]|jgi:acyl-CoA thioesterase-1
MRPASLLNIILTAFAWLLATAFTAPAATIHIVAFGDSSTAGWLVQYEEAYPAQLEALLRKKGYDVDVANEGISGDTTAGALKRFDWAIAPGTNIAIVEFGTNDLRAGASMQTLRARLTELIRSLRARSIEVLLIGLRSLDLADVARANDVLYAQWNLPEGKYRASDGAHYNAEGYKIVIERMLPQVETLIARVTRK